MDDFDRPLAERGREDAALIGKVLAREGLTPDLALVSPARRASSAATSTTPAPRPSARRWRSPPTPPTR